MKCRNCGGNYRLRELKCPYWEVVNARGDYDRYVQWKMAADKGVEDGEEQMRFFRNQVIKNAKECKFPKNQKELESFAKAVSQD